MNIQRLRNLTTGRLHTEMRHMYQDLELLTGIKGLTIFMLPRALESCEPWLRDKVKDQRFWDGKYDKTHVGDFNIYSANTKEKKAIQRSIHIFTITFWG